MDMSNRNRTFTRPFAAALDHLIRVRGETNDIVGEAVGYKSKGKAIDQIRNERSEGKYKYQLAIAKHFGYTNLEEFIAFGQELIQQRGQDSKPPPTADGIRILDAEHQGLFALCKEKELILELDTLLLIVEKNNPEDLPKIRDIISAFLPVSAKKKLKRRHTDK